MYSNPMIIVLVAFTYSGNYFSHDSQKNIVWIAEEVVLLPLFSGDCVRQDLQTEVIGSLPDSEREGEGGEGGSSGGRG